ncbi:hypothetical protein GCM10010238_17550 [Streptomyces griseoviridis]|uniref:Uncharacterized protein n=1 Tax=Streptomyces griseoviridis TaxID=45398 RepID=A0A918LBJ9_STRGD|nr:hypothetical protein GCM10010238_17550 [Streptomyces niveoruber]
MAGRRGGWPPATDGRRVRGPLRAHDEDGQFPGRCAVVARLERRAAVHEPVPQGGRRGRLTVTVHHVEGVCHGEGPSGRAPSSGCCPRTRHPASHGRNGGHGVTVLPLSGLVSAVRVPGRLVQAATASTDPHGVDTALTEAFGGGPVVCDVRGPR